MHFWFNSNTLACHKDSETYHYAYSLSQERLEKIYLDFKKYAEEGKEFGWKNRKYSTEPAEFDDINFKRINLKKLFNEYKVATIQLNICFDHSIYLDIDGLLGENPVIYLVWGELERTKEILWRKNQ